VALRVHTPAGGALELRYRLATSGLATLELYDVGGRRLLTHDLEGRGDGREQAARVATRALAPGLYWLRLRQGTHIATARVVLLTR
jgi:hypothetical protein